MSLWNHKHFKQVRNSPRRCTQTNQIKNKGTSFCACQKGSLTIEASIILPLTVGFFVCFLFFFRILQVQSVVDEALIYTGRNLAVESSVVSSDAILLTSAEGFLLSALEKTEVVDAYVAHGNAGISLIRSEFDGENITLCADYEMKLPVSFFGKKGIKLCGRNSFRKWMGNESKDAEDGWVYVTTYGTVYHTSLACRALDISVKSAQIENIGDYRGKDGQKYYPCSRCAEKSGRIVYYTDYGTLYHCDVSCASLKRSIERIPITKIGGRRLCTYCQEL